MDRYIVFSIDVAVQIDSKYTPSNQVVERRMRMALQELLHSIYGTDLVDAKFTITSIEATDASS